MLKVKEGLTTGQLANLHELEEWRLGLMPTEIRSLCLMALQDVRDGRSYKTAQRKLAHAISNSPQPQLQKFLGGYMGMMHAVLFDLAEEPAAPNVMESYLLEIKEELEPIQPFLTSKVTTNDSQADLQTLCAAGLLLTDLWTEIRVSLEGKTLDRRLVGYVKAMRRTAADYLSHFELPADVRLMVAKLLSLKSHPKKFLTDLQQTAEEFQAQKGRLWSKLAVA